MTDLPTIMTKSGLQPQSPAALRAQLVAIATAESPGLTTDLPGSLIEDVASTDVGGLVVTDQARVELVNSLTPYGSNAFILNQLGQIYGIEPAAATLTSVFVVFSGTAGFVLSPGFVVSDGSHQYALADGGIVNSMGVTAALFAVATVSGTWAVPANTVTTVVTSVPSPIVLTVTNPETGTPAGGAESEESYRSRVLRAGLASAQGMASFLKTLLGSVAGVQQRLISVVAGTGDAWEILCGGGDPTEVAYAIYKAIFDITDLTGSVLSVSGYTRANPGIITTVLNHGLINGQTATVAGSTPSGFNGSGTVTVHTEKTFDIGVDSSGYAAPYTSGGVVTPNARNITATVIDYPNVYVIPYVNPPQQTVAMTVTWNTTSTNFVSASAVAQLGAPALAAYVNALYVGVPLNLFEMQEAFQMAIASVLPPALLTRMVFTVSINGVGTSVSAGTGLFVGDPESYFFTDPSGSSITITQG